MPHGYMNNVNISEKNVDNLKKEPFLNEAHQGVMADRRHSLKRGDRLSKKERQTTASDWKKSDKLRFMLWVKSDSDIYYNKTSDKAATK
jgi:hypothetical protein